MRSLLIAFTLTSLCAIASNTPDIMARSIADYCRLLYRIETDFVIKLDNADEYEATATFINRYTHEPLEPMEIDFKNNLATFTFETMSTHLKTLYHEVDFKFYHHASTEEKMYRVNFKHLMNRCYTDRKIAPWKKIEL